ncbi:MAG: 16S rRNA (guanine(527)-N(7))-methyltransferase RsmG [Tissierellales bacterium]|jgi:16S rRNA (guanine527-N7)-methyltransferase|nr:16S rRNA (guanine(527)-N(7))-methyltransferase RsmG [Tissierellales bacterium]MBN2827212.1 16S rRNA (guanine(527)-N(7))-methyltransferase RsmG [Tissierellales bacterium]
MKTELKEILNGAGIQCSEERLDLFLEYETLIKDWNQKINITSITESHEIYVKHFLDSIIIKNMFEFNHKKIIDVGTGGGFPGIPLKIFHDQMKLTLLDSLNKRIMFLEEVTAKLHLENVQLLHGRAEDYGMNRDFRERYDVSISRAVASLNVLAEYCLPFVRVGGFFLSMKGYDSDDEINVSKHAIKILGGRIVEVKKYNLPGTDMMRSLIIVEKIAETGLKYPRMAGKPAKKPII